MKKAVVLLSGGLDSTTVLGIAHAQGYICYGLSFRYGQRHVVELEAAQRVAESFEVQDHLILDVDLRRLGGSSLTDNIQVPKDRDHFPDEIPNTYVPGRNIIFLSLALAWAETLGAQDIFIGANAVDFSGYPDCRPEFISAFQHMARVGTKAGVQGNVPYVHAPLMDLSKSQIIKKGLELGIDYRLTHSCYDPEPNGSPCCRCDSCILRIKGFRKLGMKDPGVTNNQ
ncbi:MAG: 7-cyano-7-deazaguanine synthase QueC [Kiritimatiellae bacterium]|nr:7-cyano-7-deazaguanine synthase QueC [Kiritimatiellia bacterium]